MKHGLLFTPDGPLSLADLHELVYETKARPGESLIDPAFSHNEVSR